jgi:hypothetical protein
MNDNLITRGLLNNPDSQFLFLRQRPAGRHEGADTGLHTAFTSRIRPHRQCDGAGRGAHHRADFLGQCRRPCGA